MKTTIISIIVMALLIGGAFMLRRGDSQKGHEVSPNNVSIIDGTQIIEIKAKGGYEPRKSLAQAGLKTILRFKTEGTFDCTSVLRIPSLNISQNLPPSGLTEIALGQPESGLLVGSCGMGMYPFEIDFKP